MTKSEKRLKEFNEALLLGLLTINPQFLPDQVEITRGPDKSLFIETRYGNFLRQNSILKRYDRTKSDWQNSFSCVKTDKTIKNLSGPEELILLTCSLREGSLDAKRALKQLKRVISRSFNNKVALVSDFVVEFLDKMSLDSGQYFFLLKMMSHCYHNIYNRRRNAEVNKQILLRISSLQTLRSNPDYIKAETIFKIQYPGLM